MTDPPAHVRRPRYPGRNPRKFHEKYKELDPERYASDVEKVLASGKTPAGTHRPIMVESDFRVLGKVTRVLKKGSQLMGMVFDDAEGRG